MHMCPDQPSDFGHMATCTAMQCCPADIQASPWSQGRTPVKWCIRGGALPACHLHYPQFKTRAEPGQRGDTAATQTHTHNQTAVSVEGLASNWVSQAPRKLPRTANYCRSTSTQSAFYTLIILYYTKRYLVLLSYLFTKHQKLLAAEKLC